jgi:hypothetical protein
MADHRQRMLEHLRAGQRTDLSRYRAGSLPMRKTAVPRLQNIVVTVIVTEEAAYGK